MHYYKICNLDSRIANPDQRLTSDTDKWATSLANLYLNLTKPTLDVFLFSRKLAELVGWTGPILTVSWYLFSGIIIKNISPDLPQTLVRYFGRVHQRSFHRCGGSPLRIHETVRYHLDDRVAPSHSLAIPRLHAPVQGRQGVFVRWARKEIGWHLCHKGRKIRREWPQRVNLS